MSVVINRVARALEDRFSGLIDMSDWAGKPAEHVNTAFLSRSLAALCISVIADKDPAIAGSAVVDGYDDCGIDALHFDADTDTLYLVQSKWSSSGKSSFDVGDVSKFADGIRAILNEQLERFNTKVRAKEAEIREALYAQRDINIRIITVHTSSQPISSHVARVLDELVTALNDSVPIAERLDYDQSKVYELVTSGSKDPKINLQIGINEWGLIEAPFLAYYGRVQLEQVVAWWRDHKNKLFAQNLRLYYQNSAVNDALKQTLIQDPESFWYFNNGLTIIADKVIKNIAGAPGRQFGNFVCEGVSIVNGAQTVGTVGLSIDIDEIDEATPKWVQVRIISLEKTAPDFGRRITRAANLQNAVGPRELAAMDPHQHRLATEFALDKRRYVYKAGDVDPHGEDGCSIAEATQALGCAISLELAVLVKRNVGSIWTNTDAAPYTDIFNANVGSAEVWRAVTIMRAVEDELVRLKFSSVDRADAISAHMNRVILHLVHKAPAVKQLYHDPNANGALVAAAKEAVGPIYKKTADYLFTHHPSDYLAVFCKNSQKCADLVAYVDRGSPPKRDFHQGGLFD